MVEEEQTDPLEITKDPEIIKTAQNELCKIDVLVCGECHEVFHFVEEFQEHKSGDKCTKESFLSQGTPANSKSQLWGFMLWKNAKFKPPSPEENSQPSSWNIYQLWCNLDQTQKDSWIAAGRSLQAIRANIITPTPGINKRGRVKLLNKKGNEEDEIEDSGIKVVTIENDPLADTESDLDLEEELTKHKLIKDPKCENGGIKKTILQPVELNSDVTILPSTKMKGPKKAIRTYEGEKRGEYAVEKIVSKRYNPGKKTHEYLIKWENFPDEQNTWEPVAHLESCRQLVDEFDRHLARLKAQKISRGSLVQRRPHKKTLPEKNSDLILTSTGPGRPQRTSKQKALNQVKVWCGNISDADEGGSGKRVFSDSDSDSFEKKMKLEEDSSDSDDEVRPPPVAVRKVIKAPLNGISRKQPLPENILVPDAHGVVTINQKQLPALSSGVYVMSKTAGIIKLDSNTSKIAASGGHAVIKVAPKIGQTSIKVVKRSGDPSNGSKAPTILNSRFKPMMKPIGAKVIAHRRPPMITTATTSATIVKRVEPATKMETLKIEDDESDGLEELPFPTDLPLPEPDSPPGEFTLCPLTGKVIGQEYPPSEEEAEANCDVTIKQEVTEATSANATTKQQQQSTPAANDYNSLDVLNDLNACNILVETSTAATTTTGAEVKMEVCEQQEQQRQSDPNVKNEDCTTTTTISREVENSDVEMKTPTESAAAIKQETIDKTQSIEAALSAMEGGDDDEEEDTSSTAAIATTTVGIVAASSSTSSILTTALSNANIEPSAPPLSTAQVIPVTAATLPSGATLLKKSEVPDAIRQKTAMNRHIINRTILPKPAPQAIITRITPGSVNRSKQQLVSRQQQQHHQKIISGPPPTTFRKTIRQTYSNKSSPNVIRKVISANTAYQQSNTTAILTAAMPPSPVTPAVTKQTTTTLTTLTSSTISTESLVETLTSPGPSEVINMPLLTDLETPSTSATNELSAETASTEATAPASGLQSTSETTLHSDLNSISLDGSETPLLITGEDGTIYQVAGQNEDGQTILIAQDADGQQQCLLVASESTSELGETSPAVVSTAPSTTVAVAAQEQIEEQPIVVNAVEPESENAEDSQIVAQIVSAQPPSPGGTRKVVLMLPDGNLMMTEVTAEQYAALELDK